MNHMLTAFNEQKERILAQHAQKEITYFCPVCHEPLVLKQGYKNIAHFAHRHQTSHCAHGESMLHYQLKLHIFRELSKSHVDVQLEPYIHEIQQIPDIVVGHTAIEIQLSRLSIDLIRQRTEGLERNGYQVIWVTLLPKYKNGVYTLNQLQQACIDPKHCMLYGIHPFTHRVYRLYHMMGLSSRQFHADCEPMDYQQLSEVQEGKYSEMTTVRKLSTTRILQHIIQCRRKNTVHEPTLSMMYHMKFSDTQVVQLTGYIFPEQIYIYTHPVEWQLKLLETISQQHNPFEALQRYLKFRYFAKESLPHQQIVAQLVQRYRKIMKI